MSRESSLLKVFDGNKLVGLIDNADNATKRPLDLFEKEMLRIFNEHQQFQAENGRLKGLLKAAKCPNCDGSGGIPRQVSARQLVTRDMALDAGDPDLEGSLYSNDEWELEQCQWCYERKQALRTER